MKWPEMKRKSAEQRRSFLPDLSLEGAGKVAGSTVGSGPLGPGRISSRQNGSGQNVFPPEVLALPQKDAVFSDADRVAMEARVSAMRGYLGRVAAGGEAADPVLRSHWGVGKK